MCPDIIVYSFFPYYRLINMHTIFFSTTHHCPSEYITENTASPKGFLSFYETKKKKQKKQKSKIINTLTNQAP